MFLLHTIDTLWKDHLLSMDHLREGIGLRGYAQQDPLREYKREAFQMFADLVERIKEQTLSFLYRVQVTREEEVERMEEERRRQRLRLVYSRGEEAREEKPKQQPIRRQKIGRNDPCPCGSGKKYKKCCGRPGAKPQMKKAQAAH
jgi:preprotein translocase subunit SecA